MLRFATVIALAMVLCLASAPAYAVPCWLVKEGVTIYGEARLIAMARKRGMSEDKINAARKCLKVS